MDSYYTDDEVRSAAVVHMFSSADPEGSMRRALAEVVPAIVARAKAEALREASEDMRVGWGDLLRPDGSVFRGAQHHPDDGSRGIPLHEWLTARADEIERT